MAAAQTLKKTPVRLPLQYIKQHAYVGGAWVKANNGKTFAVTNPATGEELGQVADLGPVETEVAIKKAYDAFYIWRETSAKVGLNCQKTSGVREQFIWWGSKFTFSDFFPA